MPTQPWMAHQPWGEYYTGTHPDCRCGNQTRLVYSTGCGCVDSNDHRTCFRCEGAIYPPFPHGLRIWAGQGKERCLCGCGRIYPSAAA